MRIPSIPSNEAERLAALRRYEILDTEDEAAFDALTKLASLLLDVPIALISLVDSDRQWFKSRRGVSAHETHRDISFCGHVVAEGASLVVPDATLDPRFADNPLVTGDPSVRFYAGVPLRTAEGLVLGTFCAIDHEPRKIPREHMEALELLSNQVMNLLEARRERRLLASERAAALDNAQRLGLLFEAMVEGVVVQDEDATILSANESAERILGLSIDQMKGRRSVDPRWRAVHEDGSPFPGETHPSMVTLRSGEAQRDVVMGVHKPGGELTWISINAIPLKNDGQEKAHGVFCTFHDITAIKAAQAAAERLSRQERLVTTGTLAAGVGHEINNPLAFLMANVEFVQDELRSIAGGSPSGRMRELIDVLAEAREGAERIRKIVRGLRAFAREETALAAGDVGGSVDISISMAAHEIRHKATIEKRLSTTPLAFTDESRLSQILVNLLVNAAQCFKTGDIEANKITVTSGVAPDGRVFLAVSDNGPGISPELQARIFDPFFTTKPIGQGTGLGLSISQSIARSLGAELLVESTVGLGSTFRVLLPVAEEEPSRPPAPPTGRGRVLVIDDEPAILSVMGRILGKDHEVVTLDDARKALDLLGQGERFDVVFCDLMMPNLSGAALYERVLEVAPQMAERFVFVSGGATEPRTQSFLSEVPNERIEKPFSPQNIRGMVRRFVGLK